MEKNHIVLLIHGIRTQGSWAEMVSQTLERDPTIKVQPIKYGFFDTFRFLSPFWTREEPIRRVIQEYRDTRRNFPNAKISVIAHSFGTFALTKALRAPDIELYRIILCGSIVPESFRVASHRAQITFDPILNDCGTHDIWPLLAKSVTWGYGSTGTFGFGTVGIRDRFNKFSHSQYFSQDFVEEYWRPYISEGVVVPTEWEVERGNPPYWQSLLSILPLKILYVLALALLGSWGFLTYEDSKISSIEFGANFFVAHYVGAAEIEVHLIFENNSREISEFSNFTGKLFGPSQQALDVRFFMIGERVAGAPTPMFPATSTPIIVSPSQSRSLRLAFAEDAFEQTPVLNEIFKNFQNSKLAVNKWDPDLDLVSDRLVAEISSIAYERFPLEAGDWTFSMSYSVDGSTREISEKFTLTDANISRMLSSVPYYSSGLGILPFWKYGAPDGWSIISTEITVDGI
ncbi:hypothetical protein FHY55_11785 [Oceanicola sp. D3]|uniref:alpha/beta hydrolase n=1 Tax=Oceanicola sp. D3 TaxID=2587163 RepID=UPI0011242ADD|nr:hypothetical protein [Oceanicola sp. D3]QDC09886.1 hypothetical protein FHY55_11785 [Oceanicola sp. D3]